MDFGLDFEYKCAKLFYRDNEGKAFKLSYDQKLHFIALSKQIAKGPFDPEKPDSTGYEASYFNLVGNDRKAAWQRLGNMGKQDAMMEFVGKLRENCSSFDPWYRAHVKIEQEKRKLENTSLLDCVSAAAENVNSSCNPLSPERIGCSAAAAANGCDKKVTNFGTVNGGDLFKNGGDVNGKSGGSGNSIVGSNANVKLTGNDKNMYLNGNSNNNKNNSSMTAIQTASSAAEDKKRDAHRNNVNGKCSENNINSDFSGPKNSSSDGSEMGVDVAAAVTGNSLQHLQQIEEQTTLIKNALNAQTFRQFKQYAVSRYPEDEKAQDKLISELQQQHFQQYMQHIYYQQMAQMKAMQNANSVAMNLSVSSGHEAQQISPNSKLSFEKETSKTSPSNDSSISSHNRPESFVHFDDEVSHNKAAGASAKEGDPDAGAANAPSGTNLNSPPASESLLVANPSMWANKNMKA